MSAPWYAQSPKQFLYNFWQNFYGQEKPVFELYPRGNGVYCRVAFPPEVTQRQGQLPPHIPVLEPGYCCGYGRNKKDAENAAARNGCDQLDFMGLLVRAKKQGSRNVAPPTMAPGPQAIPAWNGVPTFPQPPAANAHLAVAYPSYNGAAPTGQPPSWGRPTAAPNVPRQQLPHHLAALSLPFTGSEPFMGNPKSNFGHCWQIRGYGPPSYEYAPPSPYSHHHMFECRVGLPADLLQKIQEHLASDRCDPSHKGALTHMVRVGHVTGYARNKKDASVAAAMQGCLLLMALGYLSLPGGPSPDHTRPPPFHYRLPIPHMKGDFKCDKVHDVEPDKYEFRPQDRQAIADLMAEIDAARSSGVLDPGDMSGPEIFRDDPQRRSNYHSLFDTPMGAEELQLSATMAQERQAYAQKCMPGQRQIWGNEDVIGVREGLPVHSLRQYIIDTINGNQVSVLSGETGCGKSTQVPQYLLESLTDLNMGSRAKILVTQPRRISAISVAERVAYERAECVGKSVGYRIRLEGVAPRPRGSITFCTTGIVLRMLLDDNALSDVSHLVVDEVHERDLFTDFLLIVLRDLLPRRPHLRVVLMSATLNAELFSQYFAQHGYACPSITIPGFTHPVEHFFLDDVLAATGFEAMSHILAAKAAEGQAQRQASRNQRSLRPDKLVLQPPTNGPDTAMTTDALQHASHSLGARVAENLKLLDGGLLPLALVVETVMMIMRTRADDGAILVFLPGWEEISSTSRLLEDALAANGFGPGSYIIHQLHSQLASLNQKAVFARPGPGVRKIVLSTNIAETSITIDDVVYVVDSGRQKEKSYNATMGLQMLQLAWVSQAAVRQRKGRAGRVRAGVCYTLVSRARHTMLLTDSVPEIRRVPLEDIALQIKVLGIRGGRSRAVLCDALEPPAPVMIQDALNTLVVLGALDRAPGTSDPDFLETLTPLGKVIARLPLDVRLAKMLLWAVVLRCADPVLTIAAALSLRSPFVVPMGPLRDQADESRRRMAGQWRSDHIALMLAFNGWREARTQGWAEAYCDRNFLSSSTLFTIDKLKSQYEQLLRDEGFPITPTANMYSHSIPLVKAIIYSCVYPNVVAVKSADNTAKARFLGQQYCALKPHPRSVCAGEPNFSSSWCAFLEKVKSTQLVYCDGVSMISTAALLLLGAAPRYVVEDERSAYVAPGQQPRQRHALVLDDWIYVEMPQNDASLMLHFHTAVHDMLMHCVATPQHGYHEPVSDKITETLASLVHASELGQDLSSAPTPAMGGLMPTPSQAVPGSTAALLQDLKARALQNIEAARNRS